MGSGVYACRNLNGSHTLRPTLTLNPHLFTLPLFATAWPFLQSFHAFVSFISCPPGGYTHRAVCTMGHLYKYLQYPDACHAPLLAHLECSVWHVYDPA